MYVCVCFFFLFRLYTENFIVGLQGGEFAVEGCLVIENVRFVKKGEHLTLNYSKIKETESMDDSGYWRSLSEKPCENQVRYLLDISCHFQLLNQLMICLYMHYAVLFK